MEDDAIPTARIHPDIYPCNRAVVFIWQNFQPAYRDLGGGKFWEVAVGVHRPALLIFTLFQSNIYKVNVREYPPGIYVVKMNTITSL